MLSVPRIGYRSGFLAEAGLKTMFKEYHWKHVPTGLEGIASFTAYDARAGVSVPRLIILFI